MAYPVDSPITSQPLKNVTIFTDGGAVPNPGHGGYGVVLRFGEHCRELSGGYRLTTNNRMELMAVIVALEALKERCHVALHSDSKYIVEAIASGSAFKWRSNGWAMNVTRSKVAKNADLWKRLLAAYEKHEVEFIWVKGHAGVEDNERCDRLADAALNQTDLQEDSGYQPTEENERRPAKRRGTNTKMTEDGQACRKCNAPVVKRTPTKKTVKPNQSYYYDWYLYCPGCKSMYMVETAKREVDGGGRKSFGSPD